MLTLTVTGHLTADAITRDYNGMKVISFTVASNNRYKTTTGETKDETTFVRCALWNTRETVAPLFFKGRIVTVTGTMKTSVYPDHKSEDIRVNLDLRVTNFQVFGKGNNNEEAQMQTTGKTQASTRTTAEPDTRDAEQKACEQHVKENIFEPAEVTDDLPF